MAMAMARWACLAMGMAITAAIAMGEVIATVGPIAMGAAAAITMALTAAITTITITDATKLTVLIDRGSCGRRRNFIRPTQRAVHRLGPSVGRLRPSVG